MTNNSIFQLDMDIVKGNLFNAVISLQNGKVFNPVMGVKQVYFVGATLCMDVNEKVLTLVHKEETIGYLSGGLRRLLPIDVMRLFEALMNICEIVHTQKWVIKRVVS